MLALIVRGIDLDMATMGIDIVPSLDDKTNQRKCNKCHYL